MARASSIDNLPKEVKAWLDRSLMDNNFSGYEAFEEALRERGCIVSKSAIHRYGQKIERRFAAIKTSTEAARMREQWARNYTFFDAPVGLIFTLDRALGQGSLIDYGGFLQTLMLAARSRGLDTCVQAAFSEYHPIIHRQLGIPDEQIIICGMALGYADPAAPENALDLPRLPTSEFTRFHE